MFPERRYDPHPSETPAPVAGVFDDPSITLCLNVDWVSWLDTVIARLAHFNAWTGDDDEKFRAVSEVNKLLAALVKGCDVTPIGVIEMWLTATPPDKWLILNGQLVSRATYPELHALYGDTYDPGDGVTTFGLPDMRDRLAIGASASIPLSTINGSKTKGISTVNLPAHNHPVTDPGHTHPPAAGTTVFVGRTAGGSTDWVRATSGATFRQDNNTGSSATGITVGNTGSGTPLDVLNPVRGMHFIVYAGH